MAARRENGVWINASDQISTIVTNADGTSVSSNTPQLGQTLAVATIDKTATGTVISAVASQSIYVYALRVVSQSTGMGINWRSGASTALDASETYGVAEGYAMNVNPPAYLYKTAAGESLDIVISGTGTVRGIVFYWVA